MEEIQSRREYIGVWGKFWECKIKASRKSSKNPKKHITLLNRAQTKGRGNVTNFIQLLSPQQVDWFSQTKLHWKAPNKGYPHICGMYKSDNKWLRYQAISSCKSFIC